MTSKKLQLSTIYSASGDPFSRANLLLESLSQSKMLGVFDTLTGLRSHARIFSYVFGVGVKEMVSISDYLRFLRTKNGIFFTLTGVFDSSFRLERARKLYEYPIARGSKISPSVIIETLLSFGWIHSSHLGKPHSYYISGGEIYLRDDLIYSTISFFGDEIDDIRTGCTDSLMPSEMIYIYHTGSPNLPEVALSMSDDIHLGDDTCVVGFDLDFWTERVKLFQQVEHFMAFESQGISLGIEPWTTENLDTFADFLRSSDPDTVRLLSAHPLAIERFLLHNSLPYTVEKVPRLWLMSAKNPENIIVADDILGRLFTEKRTKRQTMRALDLLVSLRPGDYVVHIDHGVGIFREMIEKEVSGISREYIQIEYAKSDRLYVPITELYRITKYLADDAPVLHTLGGKEWKKVMSGTEADILRTAQELLELSAQRKLESGFSFTKNPPEEERFKKAFAHEHTRDQSRTIEEVFLDMESSEPMDRLVAGDVGFGKTEVAMNAAYKAHISGKQVAVISPLVVLTLEHAESFEARFRDFGVKIRVLSRLQSDTEAREVIRWLREGTIDIVLGTHRLLSEDIFFARLWLLIIDEEHRFGVMDKERIKKIRHGIDILSLSATPIPRSLNMAISGLRQLSVITTPPRAKKPIHTLVSEWRSEHIREMILRELDRGGQVIYIHNRVAALPGIARDLHDLVGKRAKPCILHGQMPGEAIEETLMDFKAEKYNLLVATTVIENGVNFLTANTIIIDSADEFGLAELHQLRGRVGRKDIDAYCLLLYRKPMLSDDAKKRLLAIVENTHLGAGFEIALRDLEIRWAGEILGIRQSGKAKETGVSLYLKLLENKVEELQTGKLSESFEVHIDLDLEMVISEEFFGSDQDKIQFYRSLESMRTIEELDEAVESFKTYHELDTRIETFFVLMRAKVYLSQYKVRSLKKIMKDYVFEFSRATTEDIRTFLELDRSGDFLVQSLERVKVTKSTYYSDLDFLTKLVYSCAHEEKSHPLSR